MISWFYGFEFTVYTAAVLVDEERFMVVLLLPSPTLLLTLRENVLL